MPCGVGLGLAFVPSSTDDRADGVEYDGTDRDVVALES
jgi:hypothetical protein